MVKTAAISEMLRELERRLGRGSFQVVDHWEADLQAVGISSSHDPSDLVYIALRGDHKRKHFDAALECRPLLGSDLPYEECGWFESVDMEELILIVQSHLCISTRRS